MTLLQTILVHGRLPVPLRGVSLDFRLAIRLLVKHLGLTVVGTVAMAFAIWCGIIAFEFYTQILRPTLPLAGGDRIVGIVMADTSRGSDASPRLHDFKDWSGALKSVQDLAAFRARDWNVIIGTAATAAGFRRDALILWIVLVSASVVLLLSLTGILAISSVAVVGPVRRALRIQPVDALRAE
jgi:ABC-type antimicrobial peptide transport system permease subunit